MNIVVICADQLRADHLGHEGMLPVKTPWIDSIAHEGHSFANAYVTNPVCMPNRASIMTGRWPSAHGVRTNGLPLDPNADTYARVLRGKGWKTAAVGKLHLQPMGYPYEEYQLDQIKQALPDLWKRAMENFSTGFQSWEDFQLHAEGPITIPEDYYGFDDVSLVIGHGDRVSGNYREWARSRGWDPEVQSGVDASSNVLASWDHVYESPVPAELHPTTFVAEEAVNRLRAFAELDSEFLLYVSFPDPHHPFAPPREYFGRYRPDEVPMPDSFFDEHESSPQYIREMVARRGTQDIDPMMLWSPSEEQFRHALAAEMGSIEFIDDAVGRILQSLEDQGLADDTVVVFTSDHGDVFGDHGLMLKHFTHYRGVIRVPLLIRGPGFGHGRHEGLASSADIAPTILDLVNAPALSQAQGQSLTRIIRGEAPSVRKALVVEEDQPYGLVDLPGPVRMRTLVTEDVRLTEIPARGIVELYDRRTDPQEIKNVAERDEALLAQSRELLLAEVVALQDGSRVPFHAA
jgi:arylsulfatase A-like enzyme